MSSSSTTSTSSSQHADVIDLTMEEEEERKPVLIIPGMYIKAQIRVSNYNQSLIFKKVMNIPGLYQNHIKPFLDNDYVSYAKARQCICFKTPFDLDYNHFPNQRTHLIYNWETKMVDIYILENIIAIDPSDNRPVSIPTRPDKLEKQKPDWLEEEQKKHDPIAIYNNKITRKFTLPLDKLLVLSGDDVHPHPIQQACASIGFKFKPYEEGKELTKAEEDQQMIPITTFVNQMVDCSPGIILVYLDEPLANNAWPKCNLPRKNILLQVQSGTFQHFL